MCRQLQKRILKTSCRALCTIILVAWTKRANASQIFSRVAIRRAFGGWEESLCSHTRLIKQHSTWPKIQHWRYVQTQIEAVLRNHLQLSWQSWKMHMQAPAADRHRIQKFRERVMHCYCAAWRLSLFEKRKHHRANRLHLYFCTDPANKSFRHFIDRVKTSLKGRVVNMWNTKTTMKTAKIERQNSLQEA